MSSQLYGAHNLLKLLFISGRMALLVTLFLVLVNIFNSVTANAPKAEGLTAVETWVVSCIIHVFGVLAEYALILKIIQAEKRRDAKVNYHQSSLYFIAIFNIEVKFPLNSKVKKAFSTNGLRSSA